MLASARGHGWPSLGYELPGHPLQMAIRQSLARWTGVASGALEIATDGCGVPVFILSLRQMALAWARLQGEARVDRPAARILDAMARQPFLVGGTERFDTVLMEETDGAVVSKVGAEGVHCVLVREQGIALAIKVADGSPRAQYPAVLRLLQHLDALPHTLSARLQDLLVTPVRDTRGDIVGDIRPAA